MKNITKKLKHGLASLVFASALASCGGGGGSSGSSTLNSNPTYQTKNEIVQALNNMGYTEDKSDEEPTKPTFWQIEKDGNTPKITYSQVQNDSDCSSMRQNFSGLALYVCNENSKLQQKGTGLEATFEPSDKTSNSIIPENNNSKIAYVVNGALTANELKSLDEKLRNGDYSAIQSVPFNVFEWGDGGLLANASSFYGERNDINLGAHNQSAIYTTNGLAPLQVDIYNLNGEKQTDTTFNLITDGSNLKIQDLTAPTSLPNGIYSLKVGEKNVGVLYKGVDSNREVCFTDRRAREIETGSGNYNTCS